MTEERDNVSAQNETFILGETAILLSGTSGISQVPQRTVEGRPVQHSLNVAGVTLLMKGTSGHSTFPQETAQGSPIPSDIATLRQDVPITTTLNQGGVGQIVGQPTRIS